MQTTTTPPRRTILAIIIVILAITPSILAVTIIVIAVMTSSCRQALDKVLNDALPVLRDDALGVELHALHVGVLLVPHAHDGAVLGPRRHLEVLGHGVALDHQRVVAAGLERAARVDVCGSWIVCVDVAWGGGEGGGRGERESGQEAGQAAAAGATCSCAGEGGEIWQGRDC